MEFVSNAMCAMAIMHFDAKGLNRTLYTSCDDVHAALKLVEANSG